MTKLNLPDYKLQSEEVKDRFERLKQRPVTLEVKNLYKHFNSRNGQVTALKDINLKIHKREFVCVIGPSGCGKSTLIRFLAQTMPPRLSLWQWMDRRNKIRI